MQLIHVGKQQVNVLKYNNNKNNAFLKYNKYNLFKKILENA